MTSPCRSPLAATALVGVLLLCSLACRSAAPPAPTAPAAPRELAPRADASILESRAVLLLLSDRRMYDPTALELMLSGPVEVRRELAVALGRIGDRRGRSLLQGLLVDSDLETRRAAAFALGELGDAEARRALIVAAVDDDPELGGLAVEALGKLGTPLAEVRRALGALDPEAGWRRLAPALFRFAEPDLATAAADGLARDEPEVRAGCAYALGRSARPEGVETMRGLLVDADPFVRAWATRGLGESGTLDDLVRIEPLLGDDALSPRIQAIRAGARLMGRFTALPPIGWGDRLSALVDDPSPGVRAAALEAAGKFLPHPTLEEALRRRSRDGEPRERELAFVALVEGRVADAGELVAAAAAAAEPRLRARAAEAAAKRQDLESLAVLAEDGVAAVRAAALEGLAEGAGDALPALAERFLDDPDPVVRATALDLAARQPGVAAARLAAAIDAGRRDPINDARLSGVRALAALAAARPAERAAVIEALDRLRDDRDGLVRREAVAGLAGLGEERPPAGPYELGRGLDYYRSVLDQTAERRRVEVVTDRGTLVVELACPEAPLTCLSFLQLARQGYFDGLAFHRVVPDFVAQGGDPRGDGWGGPGYALRDEINRLRYRRGALGMALSGPDTGGSQFFFTLSPQPHLDGGFTVFGRVIDGEAVLDLLRQGDRIVGVRELDGAPGPVG
jgi:cyclophilin family peptidyl-prolyl cis-trans isomerase